MEVFLSCAILISITSNSDHVFFFFQSGHKLVHTALLDCFSCLSDGKPMISVFPFSRLTGCTRVELGVCFSELWFDSGNLHALNDVSSSVYHPCRFSI